MDDHADRVVEVEGRLASDGREIEPLDLDEVNRVARRLRREGSTVAAVALLHSDKNPDHERRVAASLKDAGFGHVSVSSRLTPFIKILPRAGTAVVNAYLAPVVDHASRAAVARVLETEPRLDVIIDNVSSRSIGDTRRVLSPTGVLVALRPSPS